MTESNTAQSDAKVLTEVRGNTGIITMNRPKGLNSFDHDMVTAIDAALAEWKDDDTIEQVVIQGSGKHFCAGGDVKYAYNGITEGRDEEIDPFFSDEYDLNVRMSEYPKPYIALVSGVIMGGGMGMSSHGSHFVVAEDSFASMPEVFIGYIPDCGLIWHFQRLASPAVAKFLGCTGYRMTPDDLLYLGIATHKVASLDGVLDKIVEEGPSALDSVALPAGDSHLEEMRDDIERVFQGTWADIEARLEDETGEFGDKVRELIAKASPASLTAATEMADAYGSFDLEQSLRADCALGLHMRRQPDFIEGVRAVLVDKTQDADFGPAPDPAVFREILGGVAS